MVAWVFCSARPPPVAFQSQPFWEAAWPDCRSPFGRGEEPPDAATESLDSSPTAEDATDSDSWDFSYSESSDDPPFPAPQAQPMPPLADSADQSHCAQFQAPSSNLRRPDCGRRMRLRAEEAPPFVVAAPPTKEAIKRQADAECLAHDPVPVRRICGIRAVGQAVLVSCEIPGHPDAVWLPYALVEVLHPELLAAFAGAGG